MGEKEIITMAPPGANLWYSKEWVDPGLGVPFLLWPPSPPISLTLRAPDEDLLRRVAERPLSGTVGTGHTEPHGHADG